MHNLTFQKFTPESYPEYKPWFQNEALKKALGDIDKEWLAHITTQTGGVEYAVFHKEQLVGVVGIEFPPPATNLPHAITNIAVNPARNGEGIGSAMLSQLPEELQLKGDQYIIAYVEKPNLPAQAFFAKNGWQLLESDEGCDMLKYRNTVNPKPA